MLLVLGRPGSGCTTLLKILANHRLGYKSVHGDARYVSLTYEQASQYQGQIIMNYEDEVFFPSLTVGNEFIRGVSGGERKRVSIAECIVTQGLGFCWDNSTRGLDASTALEWTKAIRQMTDILRLSTIVTLYQVGNGILSLFDKVLLLAEGKQIYYGPMKDAKPCMEHLGFVCQNERQTQPGYDNYPKNADEMLKTYSNSPTQALMEAKHNYPDSSMTEQRTQDFIESVARERPCKGPYTTDFVVQVKACIVRQYQIIWGDKATFLIRQVCNIVQALIGGLTVPQCSQ
ncbi:P-loop containing nucleoside triphosphate hydrolase protein [Aspergillus caelatus]|uniref:P-loop containing nucleoside triphosphate hydrolase protein n=1 Tax=Aspergillus caelatus TaxID=61420 RepID=A0A5N7AE52_9EURO|nr:P-loop containing nucleoside triphosphate hydrolase protein [Aspergillus caelatus]KAE8368151.1 P-loop containing nucleoside triphosphate hydrolase protein [Aspergillus caelatus]